MWTRYELKERAKEVVRRFYWPAVAVCLIVGILTGQFSAGSSSSSNSSSSSSSGSSYNGSNYNDGSYTQDIWSSNGTLDAQGLAGQIGRYFTFLFGSVTGLLILTMGIVFSIIGILVSVLVGQPLMVGEQHFFLKARTQPVRVSDILYPFRSGCYGNIVITTFLQKVKIALWSLLLVVPGIIKSYEYYMVPYILAENPDLDQSRVFELSRAMMYGQKMEAFLLDLSFLPWSLLGAVTFGIVNVLWTNPYMAGTKAELYSVLRMEAIQRGITNTYELPGIAY